MANDPRIAYYTAIGPCIFSIAGCLIILVFYTRYKEFRRAQYPFIAALAAADLIFVIGSNQVGVLIPTEFTGGQVLQKVQSFLIASSGLTVLNSPRNKLVTRWFLSILTAIALVIATAIIAEGAVGDSIGYFWIVHEGDMAYFIYIGFLIPALCVLVFNCILIVCIVYYIFTDPTMSGVNGRQEFRKFALYPVVFVLCIGPTAVERIVSLFAGSSSEFSGVMGPVGAATWCFNGFANFLVYGVNARFKKRVYSILGRGEPLIEGNSQREINDTQPRSQYFRD